ncbi:GH1 family beta-glucosidase [Lyngbya confervoides]|uniref:Beta-glucosidase n=1 Tax=Lyngbya confervoides BDU141951 TaxID=1574623 RepID=A0ABD4SZT7_9CYAN|nr:GH1 family beta-glucosidase [Lyngbya confervoides]MCM1981832.1 GH1 family beta-glucosidase [Lyngbya confervoides BDU141951]
MDYQFPSTFAWGVATAAYQIEGAVAAEGRQNCVWDSFAALPGRIQGGDTAAIACDHYHRFPEDVAAMARLGVKHYRFSLAWPRIIPEGRGAVNEAGMDFYRRLLDALQDAGIEPHATLFHWDSPQALEDRYGSWRSREMAQDFADYTAAVVQRLGDRITSWMTMNEIHCFTHLGYGVRRQPPHAPGTLVSSPQQVWQTSHHALLAHGLACQAIRAASPRPAQVGLVDNFVPTVPLIEDKDHIQAAQRAFHLNASNGGIVVPALTGAYAPDLLESLGPAAPEIRAGDLDTIAQPLDWFGFNCYFGTYVRPTETGAGYEYLSFPKSYPRLHMPWLRIMPDCLYWGVRHLSETLGRRDLPIFITENGCAVKDRLTETGEVIDSDRIFFHRAYLRAAHRAIQEGFPLQGYFLWTLMDNFEWSYGHHRRFGLIYTDYKTLQRIPKASYYWYQRCIQHNRIV